MKKSIRNIIIIAVIVFVAFWAKGYYNNRYVVADSYYTQVPINEVNEDSWLLDSKGVQQEKGKRYDLVGYNQQGESKNVTFTKRGTAKDYYAPGTYIKVNVSQTLVIGVEVVEQNQVPEKALLQLSSKK